MLNGRSITGEMLIELCLAYTDSINKGSVPCIESAWTYLCQNESQRAAQEALIFYELEMSKQVFTEGKDCISYSMLKSLNKSIR